MRSAARWRTRRIWSTRTAIRFRPNREPATTQRQTKGDGLVAGLGGRTALQFAAREGLSGAAAALVEAGADVNGVNPLDGSTRAGRRDRQRPLRSGDDPARTWRQSEPGDEGRPGRALRHDRKPMGAGVVDADRRSPRPTASCSRQTDYLELMKALLARGADPNARIVEVALVQSAAPQRVVGEGRRRDAVLARGAGQRHRRRCGCSSKRAPIPTLAPPTARRALAVVGGRRLGRQLLDDRAGRVPAGDALPASRRSDSTSTPPTRPVTPPLMGAAWRGDNELIEVPRQQGRQARRAQRARMVGHRHGQRPVHPRLAGAGEVSRRPSRCSRSLALRISSSPRTKKCSAARVAADAATRMPIPTLRTMPSREHAPAGERAMNRAATGMNSADSARR